jgi:hypothetical protein
MRQRSVATVSPTRTRRRREALSDVVGGLDEVDAVTRGPLAAATAYGRVLAARVASSIPASSTRSSMACATRASGCCVNWNRPLASIRGRMSARQKYRLRAPSSGREVIIEAEPDEIYVDRDSGEELQVVAKLLPLAPSESELPWAVENLRICNWCEQLAPKDLNDCPHCGRRMAALERLP